MRLKSLVAALVMALLTTIGVAGSLLPAYGAPRAVVVLDPDDNVANAAWPGVGTVTELPNNMRLANEVKARLENECRATVVVTRDGSQNYVDRADRKAIAQSANPDVMVTVAFNGLTGQPWGVEADGGPRAYSRPQDVGFAQRFLNQIPSYTGRPATAGVGTAPDYPWYPEYGDLTFPWAHVEALFLDHNYDYPVIEGRFDLVADGVFAGILDQMNAQGLSCNAYPTRPSADELKRLRNLGYQNFQRYGADPVSMSTGNFVTSEEVFRLPGLGAQQIDTTINYNAQDGRDSQVGAGWSFAYGSYTQQYDDDSVSVVLTDGRTFLFEPDGNGGFKTPAGSFATLSTVNETTLRWASTTGEVNTFDVDDATGRGVLTSATDRQGNTITLTYDGMGAVFPKLASITDQAGQVVQATTDEAGRVTSLTRPDGATWKLAYTEAGDLASLTSPTGKVRSFGYDDQHRMTSEVGADGVTYLRNVYDEKSRVVQQFNSVNAERTLVFDDDARTTTYTDTTGAVTVYYWDEAGRVIKVVDALSGEVTTAYNGDAQTTANTDQLGRTTTSDYTATGQLATVTDPSGAVTTSTFNDRGDVTSTTDQGGQDGAPRTTTFSVNEDGLPVTITNPDGTTRTSTYSAAGDLLTQTDELGHTTTFGYDERGNITSVTDANGHVTRYSYDLANRLTATTDSRDHTTRYSYDGDDNLTQIGYPNDSTDTYTYDANDQVITHVDRRGAAASYAYDTELNLITTTLPNGGIVSYTFDAENRLTSMTDPLGAKTTYTLDKLGRVTKTTDPRGNVWTTSYNAAGETIKTTDPTGAETSYGFDKLGQPITVTAADGGTTRIDYDAVGRVVSVTDPLKAATAYQYNFRDQVTTTTDPLGHTTTTGYDEAGRTTSQTDERGATTSFELDDVGNRLKVTDALGGVTTTGYDVANNPTTVIDANGHSTSTSYDVMNQPVATTDGLGNTTTLHRDLGGLITTTTDPLGQATSTDYDAMQHVVKTTDPLGRVTESRWDLAGRKIAVVAPDGTVTLNAYDPNGNLTAVTENAVDGAPTNSDTNVTTTYGYDPRNLLTDITDAVGGHTVFAHDSMGRVVKETNQIGKVTTYGYDLVGNRTTRVAANGVTTRYQFDKNHHLIKTTYSNGEPDNTFTYDPAGAQTAATNGTGTVTTSYDKLGRPVVTVDAANQKLTMSYDAVGNRTTLTLPNTQVVTYTYDAANHNTGLSSPLGEVTVAYDAAGRPTSVTRPNGTTTTSQYNAASEITELLTRSGNATLATFAYTFTPNSYVNTRQAIVGGTSTNATYSYDKVGRLIKSDGSALPSTYSYDAVGNRITWAGTDDPSTPKPDDPFTQTNTYNLAGQLTTSVTARHNGNKTFTNTTTNTWDANGNLTLSSTRAQAPGQSNASAYAYDAENRLIAAGPANTRGQVCGRPGVGNNGCPPGLNKGTVGNSGNGTTKNTLLRTYDAVGRLVTETAGKSATTWTHDGLDPIYATTDGPGNGANDGTATYLRDGYGDLLGQQAGKKDTVEWYVSDALGSILGTINSSGQLNKKNTTDYSDYGVQLADTELAFGYTGERVDPSGGGLVNFYSRNYLPSIGTWIQMDLYRGNLSVPATLHRHLFVAANPSTLIDVYGFAWSDAPRAVYQFFIGDAIDTCSNNFWSWSCGIEVAFATPWGKAGKGGKAILKLSERSGGAAKRLPTHSAPLGPKLNGGAGFNRFNGSVLDGRGARSPLAYGAPRFITTPAGVTIDRAAVSTRVSRQRQGRHVLGDRNYNGGSYFNSADDAQGVLDAFHGGAAEVLGVKGNDIVVRVPGITGFNHNPGAGFPNQLTNVFFIKGSTSPSVVPYNPVWTP